jgi:arabinofuranosyltransferase
MSCDLQTILALSTSAVLALSLSAATASKELTLVAVSLFQRSWTTKPSLIAVSSLLIVLFHSRLPVDDAFITYRYVYNLANFHQLTFNIGEYLEAQTNLLWSLLLCAFYVLGFSIPEVALVASSLCLIFIVVRIFDAGKILNCSTSFALFVAICAAINLDAIRSGTNGLEAALYMALLMEILYSLMRGRILLAYFLAGLCFLVRPEALMIGPILLATHFYTQEKHARAGFLFFSLIVISVTAFRLYYYGSLVPNSIVAKSLPIWFVFLHPRSSLTYIVGFLASNLGLGFLAALSVYVAKGCINGSKNNVDVTFLSCGLILASYCIVIRNSGDWMSNYRLLIQYTPAYFSILLLLRSSEHRNPNRLRLSSIAAGILLVGSITTDLRNVDLLQLWPLGHDDLAKMDVYASPKERLDGILTPSDVISAEAIGYISFEMPNQIFHDPTGLADRYIARHGKLAPTFGKEDIDYTLGIVRPSILFWHSSTHLRGAKLEFLQQYITRCLSDCDLQHKRIVMVRRDRPEIDARYWEFSEIEAATLK